MNLEVDFTEEMVFNAPPGMEGWRCYRIEYGGPNESTIIEGRIWLPRHADIEAIETLLLGMITREEIYTFYDFIDNSPEGGMPEALPVLHKPDDGGTAVQPDEILVESETDHRIVPFKRV